MKTNTVDLALDISNVLVFAIAVPTAGSCCAPTSSSTTAPTGRFSNPGATNAWLGTALGLLLQCTVRALASRLRGSPRYGRRPGSARARMRRSVIGTDIALAVLVGALGIWLFYVQHQFEDVFWGTTSMPESPTTTCNERTTTIRPSTRSRHSRSGMECARYASSCGTKTDHGS